MSTPQKKSTLAIIISIVVAVGGVLTGGALYTKSITQEGNNAPIVTIQPINTNNIFVNQTVFINATITDDGSIKSIIWSQEAGPDAPYNQVAEDLYFTPPVNGSYLWQLEVKDDKNAKTETGFLVNVGKPSTPIPPPEPEPNKPPVLEVDSPIKCIIGSDCTMTTESISDPDGNITAIIWNQESGSQVNFNTSPDKYTATFIPTVAGTYVFSVEVQDNDGAATLKTITVNVPVVTPPTCKPNEHLENGVCVPNPVPVPEPTTDAKVIITGDVDSNSGGTNVYNAIKKQNPTNVIVLGDLGYDSDLKWFKSTYGSLGNKLNCVIGNHDSPEDGSSSIFKEAQAYCGDSYYFKKNHVLFMGFDSNGDLTKQATEAGKLLTNTEFMNGIKSVHVMTHKPCANPPNAHHGLEIKTFCDSIKSKIPSSVKTYYDNAHNHVMSSSADGTYKTIGAGGRSHYTCGTSTAFPFCDNSHFGYLQYDIKPDGTTTSAFYDSNGGIVK